MSLRWRLSARDRGHCPVGRGRSQDAPSISARRLVKLRWDPDLSPRVVGLNPQGWEDDHNEEEQAYP